MAHQPPVSIVAIHGVGDAAPGEILKGLSNALGKITQKGCAEFERCDLLSGGQVYPRMKSKNATLGREDIGEVIEVNWADVLRPESSRLGVLTHLGMLIAGMRNVSMQSREDGSRIARGCRIVFWVIAEYLGLWAALLSMMVMLLYSSKGHPWQSGIITVIALVTVWALTKLLRKGIPHHFGGYIWLIVFAVTGLLFCWPESCGLSSVSPWISEALVETSNYAYQGSQIAAMAMLFLSCIFTVTLGKGRRSRKFALAGFLWIPFCLSTAILTGLWASVLAYGRSIEGGVYYRKWERIFTQNLCYDLKFCEAVMAISILAAFLIVPTVAGLRYWWLFRKSKNSTGGRPRGAGRDAHDMIEVFLAAGTFLILAAMMVCAIFGVAASSSGASVLNIYAGSALRLGAFLTLIRPGVRAIIDAAGDVLFHIQNPGNGISSSKTTQARLNLLLQTILQRPGHRVIILAHSQGSVISAELLDNYGASIAGFITCGSPISTLYDRFLRTFVGKTPRCRWYNVFRRDDYIGGRIRLKSPTLRNINIGPGGHTNYWSDPLLLQRISKILEKNPLP